MIYKNGGKIISKYRQLFLIVSLLFITILVINAVSASQIEDDSIETVDLDNAPLNIDGDALETDDSGNDPIINDDNLERPDSSDESDSLNEMEDENLKNNIDANVETANDYEQAGPVKSKIIVQNASVVKERNLVLQLLDSNNKSIANKKISITFNKKTYTNTTDKNGRISIKISLNTGNYTVNLKFAGDENYTETSRNFTMKVYKLKTHFVIPNTSVIRGRYFYAYLKDQNNKSVSGENVTINFRNKDYVKKTDKNGMVKLLINSNIGKYDAKYTFKGSDSYLKTTEKLTVKSYNATTKITFNSLSIIRGESLHINLKYNTNKLLGNRKLTIIFNNKKYIRTTNQNGRVNLKITRPVGSYKIQVKYAGGKGFKKSSRSTTIKIHPNYTAIFSSKNKTAHGNAKKIYRYYIKLTDLKGNILTGENVTLKVKCNNFTSGTGRKITKKTIVLSSDNIYNKKLDKQRLNSIAKLLRAKGYKVIVYGIGPNYHVNSVKNYKNVCVYHLVGGIDSGMYVDMASNYYQNYLKKNKNQFVLGCFSPTATNLANKTSLKRAHDDNYSPKSFTGIYFPGKYLHKNVHIDYIYGTTPKDFANNFLKYAKKGKSIGAYNMLPGRYTTYKVTTSKTGYVHIDLPIGNYTVVCNFINKNNGIAADKFTAWVNVIP